MLRTVRSLPSLRLLYQQETNVLKKQTSTYSYVSGELFHPSTSNIRHVHQTTKKETILLDSSSNKAKYTSMNLQGLKMECKKRGLKVSGRKLDLVQRLVSQEQIAIDNSRGFSGMANSISVNKLAPPNPQYKNSIEQQLTKANIKGEISKKQLTPKQGSQKLKMQSISDNLSNKNTRVTKEESSIKSEIIKSQKIQQSINFKKPEEKSSDTKQTPKLKLKRTGELKVDRDINLKKDFENNLSTKVEEYTLKIKKATKDSVNNTTKEATISKIVLKAQQQSKLNVIANAKEQLQLKAKEQQKQQQQQQQHQKQEQRQDKQYQKERNEQQDNLTSRDVKFLTAFGLSTIGWWSLKGTSV
jgi:hypothetical protein